MKNLKRALSLALASVMLLGMMVVGTSAASYPDVDEKDNVEAIEVLNAVNVMIGRQGNFEPDEAVNRHEMAVIMAKLVLGVDTADNYVGSHPFTDVVPWADKYVAACYENGLIAGTSATTYGGSQPLTAVQAAAMMLRALGYKDLNKGYQGDWRAPITAKANEIRLFNGVASNPNQELNRNQVAQLALNTLKSPMVNLIDGTFTATGENGQLILTGGAREYKTIVSGDAYAKAISDVEGGSNAASSLSGYAVELGEQLYNGKLKLSSITDDFGRPARQWEYDGKKIGSYAKTELLDKAYVGKVTGKDLYDLLGSSTIKNYDLLVKIDGVEQDAEEFRALMDRNNKAAVGATGTGVVTEVYTDTAGDGTIYIAIINTYLAKATKDYDEKKEELTVTVYGVKRVDGEYVKDKGQEIASVSMSVEDFPMVKDMKKDDFLLLTLAGSDVMTAQTPEVLEGVSISGFKVGSDVVVNGQKYAFTTTARYDSATLKLYTSASTGTINLQDAIYNIYLDNYGNLIGVKEVNAATNYVFITGADQGSSNYANKTATALGLFLDGTSAEITYKTDKGNPPATNVVNQWCTYTKDSSNVYTLRTVGAKLDVANGVKLAQFNTKDRASYDNAFDITSVYSTLQTNDDGVIYGKGNTVYLVADRKVLANATPGAFGAIVGTDTVTTDVKKADINVFSKTVAENSYKAMNNNTVPAGGYSYGVYALYNDGFGIIAAVVIGEENGAAGKWYSTGDEALLHEDYGNNGASRDASTGEWVWTRTLFDETGEMVTLTERGDSAEYLKNMNKNQTYLIKLNAKGEVYRAYRLPGDTEGDVTNLKTILEASQAVVYTPGADNSRAEVVTNPNYIGDAVKTGKSNMLVSCEVTNDRMRVSQNEVLYANNTNDSGFNVNDDTKVIVIRYNRNVVATYTDGTGYDYLKNAVNEINQDHNNGNYDYKITAVLKDRIAKSVIIVDNINDWTGKPTTPTGKDSLSSNGVTLIVDKSVGASNFAATIADTGALSFQFATDMGAIDTATFTYDYVLKNADGVIVARNTGETTVAATKAEVKDTYGANALVKDGKAYTLEITNLVPSAYKLTKDSKANGIAAADVTVNAGATSIASTPAQTLTLKIPSAKITAPDNVNITFTVEGVDLTKVRAASGVSGSNGTYTYANLAVSSLNSGVLVLRDVVPTGEVKVTVTSVTDASSNVKWTLKLAEGSEKYVDATALAAWTTTGTVAKDATTVNLSSQVLKLPADTVTGATYVVKATGVNPVSKGAVQANGNSAALGNITIGAAKVGTPIVIEIEVTPTQFTLANTRFKLLSDKSGAAVNNTVVFDKDGKIEAGSLLTSMTNNASYEVSVNGSEGKLMTADGSGAVAAAAGDFQVAPADLVDTTKKIEIVARAAFKISGDGVEAGKYVLSGDTYTLPAKNTTENWEGTGMKVTPTGGTATYKAYGATITPTADVTLAKDYIEIDYTKGVSTATVTITPATGSSAMNDTGKGFAKANTNITIGAASGAADVTVKDSDNAFLKESGGADMNAKQIAEDGSVTVTVGEKNITITDADHT